MKSGSRKKRKIRLSDRDRRFLERLGRTRMTWLAVLIATEFKPEQYEAAHSMVRRLMSCSPPLVRSCQLRDRKVYYQLTYAGTRLLGISHRAAQKLGTTTVLRQFAIQSFLHLGTNETRKQLRKEQLTKLLNLTTQKCPAEYFYLASTSESDRRFGYLIIDYGNTPRRFADRILKRVIWLLQFSKVEALNAAGSFEITVLTVSQSKGQSIAERLKLTGDGELRIRRKKSVFVFRLKIHVVDGLMELIPDARN